MHWCWYYQYVSSSGRDAYRTDSVSLDISIDNLSSFRIHCHSTGAVDDAAGDNGLGVDARQGLRGLIGQDGGFGSHCIYFRWDNCKNKEIEKCKKGLGILLYSALRGNCI